MKDCEAMVIGSGSGMSIVDLAKTEAYQPHHGKDEAVGERGAS